MIPQSILLQWINKACGLHPNNKEFDAVKFGEFEYVARCAYKYCQDSIMHLEKKEKQ